jgi:hypothetical protein
MNKHYVKDDNLIIEIPLKVKRHNPYTDEDVGEMDNIIGIIDKDRYGFAYQIDMDYKGKSDQWTDIFYDFFNKAEFVKFCQDNNIEVIEYEICNVCGKTLYGYFNLTEKGNFCDKCYKE